VSAAARADQLFVLGGEGDDVAAARAAAQETAPRLTRVLPVAPRRLTDLESETAADDGAQRTPEQETDAAADECSKKTQCRDLKK
jgi:hypothetical protein